MAGGEGFCARHLRSDGAATVPAKYLDTMSKSQRVGRIFLDYLRNDRTATAVAPLSPRARAGATVSMPLNWPEVKAGLDPKRFTVRTAPALLEKSKAWKDYDESAQSLARAIRRVTQSKVTQAPRKAGARACGASARHEGRARPAVAPRGPSARAATLRHARAEGVSANAVD